MIYACHNVSTQVVQICNNSAEINGIFYKAIMKQNNDMPFNAVYSHVDRKLTKFKTSFFFKTSGEQPG